MISFEKAYSLIECITMPVKTERIQLVNALNRVLAEDIHSDTDIPAFDKSAMDGFACRKTDIHNTLEIIEEIPAGKIPFKTIGLNQCSRIMTGGTVPEGADIVVQQEYTEEVKPGYIRCIHESLRSNICYTGEDVHKDEVVLKKGELICAQHVSILAMSGKIRPLVYSIFSVAVISTGNELVEPDDIPGKSKIRNSNGWQLMAQASDSGYHPVYLGIVEDNEAALTNKIAKALAEFDIVLVSGGVSVGDYDFVPKALKQLGVEIIFHGLDAKPGKHMLFGKKENKLIFGLPGNPVSSFVQFELLIRPLLRRLRGIREKPRIRQIPMEIDFKVKKAETLSFIPGNCNDEETVTPVEYHGSAHIHAYRHANCIIEIPKGVMLIKKGELVNVRSL